MIEGRIQCQRDIGILKLVKRKELGTRRVGIVFRRTEIKNSEDGRTEEVINLIYSHCKYTRNPKYGTKWTVNTKWKLFTAAWKTWKSEY